MLAMTAARLGQRDRAVDFLLKDGPHNHYTPNGHCPQPGADLAVYLPDLSWSSQFSAAISTGPANRVTDMATPAASLDFNFDLNRLNIPAVPIPIQMLNA